MAEIKVASLPSDNPVNCMLRTHTGDIELVRELSFVRTTPQKRQ
jgi:hypothetical protein